MKRATSRLVAGALSLAVVGSATGGVIAQADDAAPRAEAAQQGGISITPATVEATAKRGSVGTFTVKNTTKDTLRVTVTVRPWSQNRTTAVVSLNWRASLTPYVRASPQTFDLKPGSRFGEAEHAASDRRGLALRRHPGLREAEEAEGDQRDHPAVPGHRAPAPEPDQQAPEPARRRH